MKKKNLQCPYTDISCTQIDTSGMTQLKPCIKCEHYNNGVRLTGPTPILHEMLSYFSKIISK